ncbi:MAG: hypothetical protein KA007_03205 [Candidatus Pacebacteria bacterium]|nr:hypothetical protein [Candidatus Paceibacterota bacterium]
MNLSKNKIIAGVIGLIAVVGVVNTQAIVSLTNHVRNEKVVKEIVFNNENQEAQVFSTSSTSVSKCIQVLPSSDNRTSFIDHNGNINDQTHEYLIGFKIRNRCNSTISIIRDGILTNPQLGFLQKFPTLNSPAEISFSNLFGPQPVQPASINALGTTAQIPYTLVEQIPGITSDIYRTDIPANSERDFFVYAMVEGGSEDPTFVRLSLNKFRWFILSNFNGDNFLSQNEIRTFTFSPNTFVSSYARFDSCAEGTIIGYDGSGSPIYCHDEGGNEPCAPGTVIGYNKDGSPIFCK